MRKIAFFDFDGTITSKDTMLEVIKYQKGKAGFYAGFFFNLPLMIALKLNVVSSQFAKEKMLAYFFRGMEEEEFQSACDLFSTCELAAMIRPAAITEIEKLKKAGFKIVVVSASAENWVKKWCRDAGVELISSRLEVKDGLITGKLRGLNCNGEEKAVRIQSAYNLSEYDEIYCYGDTKGDQQMLALATKAFYKPFR